MNIGNTEQELRKLQLEAQNRTNSLESRIGGAGALLQDQVSTEVPTGPPPTPPPITQILTNTDLSHSVETGLHKTATVGDQNQECANVYAHVKPNPRIVVDGAITAADNTFTTASNPFVVGDVGSRIIVYGAGTAGAKHVTTIASYTGPGSVELTDAAITTVSNAKARFRLQKLGRVNSIVSGANPNDALKSSTHADFATNIQDPSWKRTEGWATIGGLNTLDFFLGTWNDDFTGDTPGTSFIPSLYGMTGGREMYFICKLAKAHAGVKVRGNFFAGIWNNDDRNLEYLSGNEFTVDAGVVGSPASTATTKYMIVARTDRGYTFFSNIKSLASAPDANSYIPGQVYNNLAWGPAVPATLTYTIYRQIGSANVEIIGVVPNGDTRFTDNNPVQRIDTGLTTFPTQDPDRTVKSYTATLLNDLDDLIADGEADWRNMELIIPMPDSISYVQATELVLRVGLTEPLSLEVLDAVLVDDTITITNPWFSDAKHNGKTIILTNLNDLTDPPFTTTVQDCDPPGLSLVLDAVPTFGDSDNVMIEILAGEPNGLYLDLMGLSLNRGRWAANNWDNTRRQLPVAMPNASTQGGTGVIEPPPPGGGQVCFAWFWEPTRFDTRERFLAMELKKGDRLFNGSARPSIVKRVKFSVVDRAYQVTLESGITLPPVTLTHRFVQEIANIGNGTPLQRMLENGTLLRFPQNKFIMDSIRSIKTMDYPDGLVVISIELEEQDDNEFDQTFLLGDVLNHNRKNDGPESPNFPVN
jgi:hypothetical protein